MNLEIGSTVGDYQIIDVLGAGGMGKVFKVRNTISDRIEALKVLLPDLAGEPDLADRFLREIKVLASLTHPNIAGLRTALRVDNQLLMVMELVEGETLDHRMQNGPLPVAEAAACISQVLSALTYAHGKGVVHRDLKPANMMLMQDGTVKLMDFGIAKGATDRKLTMTGTTMGSLYYMSPEQIRGAQTLDVRSDLYSVGVSLYELVTGKRPFDGDSQFAIMSAHLEKTPVAPIVIDPRLPEALNDLILFSVNREPEARFQSAEAFQRALNSVVPGSAPAMAAKPAPPVAAAAAAAPAPAAKPAPGPIPQPAVVPPRNQSHRAAWVTLGAVCCVVVVGSFMAFGPSKKAAANLPATPAATTPAVAAPVDTPQPAATAPAPAPTTDAPPAPVAMTPAVTTPATAISSPAVTSKPGRPATSPVQSSAAPGRSSSAQQAQQQPVNTPAQQPATQQPAVSAAPVQANPAPAVPQPDVAAKRAELQKVRISLATMSARASSVHGTLQSIQNRQAASGLGLRGDWVQAASLMDTFFQGSNDALNAGDAAAAKDLMEKGERQLEKLEKALNK